MPVNNIHVRVTLNADNLEIRPEIPMFGGAKRSSPLILHNNTPHTILIWASAIEQGGTNESSDHIAGWQELVGDGGQLTLLADQNTPRTKLKIIGQSSHFWLHAKVKTGHHGGGLTASVEIPVEPT